MAQMLNRNFCVHTNFNMVLQEIWEQYSQRKTEIYY